MSDPKKSTYELSEEEQLEEEKSGQLHFKTIQYLIKQLEERLGQDRIKRATILVGDSK
jgi:hypothetical protein